MICILPRCLKYQPEDNPYRVETYSWLTYCFYGTVFLTAVNLPLFILQHTGMHYIKIRISVYVFSPHLIGSQKTAYNEHADHQYNCTVHNIGRNSFHE